MTEEFFRKTQERQETQETQPVNPNVGRGSLQGVLKKCFWSAKACFCDFFEIWMCLYPNYLIFEKNRTSKLVHSDLGFFNSPLRVNPNP